MRQSQGGICKIFISKSSLNQYLQCPKKYYYQHIEKIKTETSQQMQRGIDVHEFCNKFYDHLNFRNNRFTISDAFLSETLYKTSGETKQCIENFIDFEFKRWNICQSLYPKNPKKLFMPLLRESKFFSDSLEQVTIIDRLDQRLDSNYTLVEYKTERYEPKPWKLAEFRREMCFERTTIENSKEFKEKFLNDVSDFVIYFPRSNDVLVEQFNWRSLRAMKNAIEKMKLAVQLQSFPCNVDYHCRFCPHSLICPMEMQ